MPLISKLFAPRARRAISVPLSTAMCAALVVGSVSAEPISADDYLTFDPVQARLGQMLFYDKLLSGNLNISCATCHHHDTHSADAVSLGIGEGGYGIGEARQVGTVGTVQINHRVPRNAPALWNIGHKSVQTMFHDGRIEVVDGVVKTPAGDLLPEGLNSLVATQALFPMSSATEMAGTPGENEVADAFAERIDLGWEEVAARVRSKPGYETAFIMAFPEVETAEDITIVQIANAIGAFVGTEWQSHDSPYDAYLANGTPLEPLAERGRELFFGEAGCASCHSGPLFTDQQYHAVGLPQFGPGRPFEGNDMPRDMGRMETTRDPKDAYRFRTPSLRNVALTGPYGHNGAYTDLRDMIRHMCDPITARASWTPGMARLPDVPWLNDQDFVLTTLADEETRQMQDLDITPVAMVDADIDALEAFLHSLTGKTAFERPLGRPDAVPSRLPVD